MDDEQLTAREFALAAAKLEDMPSTPEPLTLFALPNEIERWREWFPGCRILPRPLRIPTK